MTTNIKYQEDSSDLEPTTLTILACFISLNFRARRGIKFCMAQTPSFGDKNSVSVPLKVAWLVRDAGMSQS